MSTSVLSGIGIKTHLDTEYIINKIFNLSGFENFSKSGFIEEVDNLFRRIKDNRLLDELFRFCQLLSCYPWS